VSQALRIRGRGLLFILFLFWPVLLVDTSGPPMTDSALLAAIRLVDDHTWTLSDQTDPSVVFMTEAHDISVYDGRVYSGVGPGASVVAAPFYFVFKPVFKLFDERVIANSRILNYYTVLGKSLNQPRPGHFKDMYLLQLVLVFGLMGPLFAYFLIRLHRLATARGCDRVQATVVVFALGLGSMLLYYSSMYSRQGLAYLLVWHALLTLIESPAPSRRSCVVVGLLCGAAISIEYASALLVGLSLAFLLPRLATRERLLTLFPVLALVGLTALYHHACFGSPFATPYHYRYWLTPETLAAQGLDLAVFQQGPLLGMNPPNPGVMFRLCFGWFKGLFVHSPILLLGLIGSLLGLGRGSDRRFHAFGLLVFTSYLVFNSSLGTHVPEFGRHFWGGLSVLWGPRYLFAVLPFLAYGLTRLDWSRVWVRGSCYVFLLVSLALNILGAMFSHVMMSTAAFGPELALPLVYVSRLLVHLGPRVTLLDGYGVAPVVQWAVLLAVATLSIMLLLEYLKPGAAGSRHRGSARSPVPPASG